MKSWTTRSRLLALGVFIAALTALVVGPTLVASGATGTPSVTVNASTNGSGKLRVTGQYSDPTGVCDLANRPVTITTRTGSFSGPVVDTSTTTTAVDGSYTKNTTFTTVPGTTYYITVVVTGMVVAPYGMADVCMNATGTTTFMA